MYQPGPYMQNSGGCFGCFGGGNQMVPQGYGYNPYASNMQGGLTTSIVAPIGAPYGPQMGMAPMMDPMYGQQQGLYQSRTIMAPPIINKAMVNMPQSSSRVELIPYQVRETVYDTVQKVEVVPIQKTITQYQQLVHKETYPVQRMVTDYYAMEYLTEFMPQVRTEAVTDYVQQEVVNETVNYVPIETQRVIPVPNMAAMGGQIMGQNQMIGQNQMMGGQVYPGQMGGSYMQQGYVAPSIYQPPIIANPPMVTSVLPNVAFTVSNVSQPLQASMSNYGYGMGPTVGTVVGANTYMPGYGVTAVTY